MSVVFADHLNKVPPYIPGKSAEAVEREMGIKEALKLASNENFRGPSLKVMEAIWEKIPSLNLYPEGKCFQLRNALGNIFGLHPTQVIIGHGSNHLIELICRCALNPGDEGITCEPTFPFYRRAIKGALGKHTPIPLKNFEVEIDDLLRAQSDRTRVIFIASPNNPTGRAIPFIELKRFMKSLEKRILVVLDEAYFEFVTAKEVLSGLNLLAEYQNLIVLRTFSKMHSLAGLRIGYGLAHASIIQALMKLFLPFSVGPLSEAAALVSLEEENLINDIRRINEEGKKFFYKELQDLGLEFLQTEANFVLIRVGNGTRAYHYILKKGIIIRDMLAWNLPEYIRVTISLPEHNRRFIEELKEYLRQNPDILIKR